MWPTLSRKAVQLSLGKSVGNVVVHSVRNSAGVWTYRRVPPLDSKTCNAQTDIFMGFVWYWVFYNCLTQYEHLYPGHWVPPNPRKEFTNAELGIPDIGDENPAPSDMRVRKERPRFLPTNMVDLYHEWYGGTRVLPKRAAYAAAAKDVVEEEEEEEDDE